MWCLLVETLHVVVMKESFLYQLTRLIFLQGSSVLIIHLLKSMQVLSINYRIKHQILGLASVAFQNQTRYPSGLNSD